MRRLIRSLPLLSLASALALAAPAARAQTVGAGASPQPPARAFAGAAAPLPRSLAPSATPEAAADRARSAEIPRALVQDAAAGRRRSGWRYPLIGLGVGTLVGAAYGTWVMLDADEWLAPPAHIVTVPAGAVLGLAIGGLANLVAPR
ncbi:MAG TPA: hypothetical protein VF006_24240 [Longimicrobium sp.]